MKTHGMESFFIKVAGQQRLKIFTNKDYFSVKVEAVVRRCSVKKVFLKKNFTKFTEKYLYQSLFFIT